MHIVSALFSVVHCWGKVHDAHRPHHMDLGVSCEKVKSGYHKGHLPNAESAHPHLFSTMRGIDLSYIEFH